MSEMVERVARAIQASTKDDQDHWMARPWDDCLEETRNMRRREARAAIEAMREPTEGMLEAVLRDNSEDDEADLANWQAMIDAALK